MVILTCALACAGCNKAASTDELIEDLSSTDTEDRVRAVRLLQNRQSDGDKVVPAMINLLNDKAINVRLSAIIGLGYFGAEAESALPELEKAEKDSDGKIRRAATTAIARIRGEE
jgi:HEAT repeat protein